MKAKQIFLRSSFGMNINKSKDDIESYAYRMSVNISHPVRISFARMPIDKSGASWCAFSETGSVMAYNMVLNNVFLDTAGNHDELDAAFIDAIIAAGHEITHIKQFEEKDPEITLCHLASISNNDNYDMNYFQNKREIAAEWAGIVLARTYLTEQYPNLNCDAHLLEYIRNKTHNKKPYYICEPLSNDNKTRIPFKSVDEAIAAFSSAYKNAQEHINTYKYRIDPESKDAFVLLTKAGSRKRIDHDWKFMFDALTNAKNANESNMVLASAGLYVYPELSREAVGTKIPDLNLKAVFGQDVPVWAVGMHINTKDADSFLQNIMARMKKEHPGIENIGLDQSTDTSHTAKAGQDKHAIHIGAKSLSEHTIAGYAQDADLAWAAKCMFCKSRRVHQKENLFKSSIALSEDILDMAVMEACAAAYHGYADETHAYRLATTDAERNGMEGALAALSKEFPGVDWESAMLAAYNAENESFDRLCASAGFDPERMPAPHAWQPGKRYASLDEVRSRFDELDQECRTARRDDPCSRSDKHDATIRTQNNWDEKFIRLLDGDGTKTGPERDREILASVLQGRICDVKKDFPVLSNTISEIKRKYAVETNTMRELRRASCGNKDTTDYDNDKTFK